jgi:hypothetical protein
MFFIIQLNLLFLSCIVGQANMVWKVWSVRFGRSSQLQHIRQTKSCEIFHIFQHANHQKIRSVRCEQLHMNSNCRAFGSIPLRLSPSSFFWWRGVALWRINQCLHSRPTYHNTLLPTRASTIKLGQRDGLGLGVHDALEYVGQIS